MLGVERESCKVELIDSASKDNWMNSNLGVNQLACKLVQAEGSPPFVPVSEDELIEVQHLLADPQTEKSIDDNVMYLDSDDTGKFLAIEDFPCTIDFCDEKADYEILHTGAVHAKKQDSMYEFVESMWQGGDEEENLHLTCTLSSTCPDYLFGTGLEESSSQLDWDSCYGLSLVGSECYSQSMEKGIGEMSDLSTAINAVPEPASVQSASLLDNANVLELQYAFRSLFGRDTYVRDRHWLKHRLLFGLQNLTEISNVSSLVETGQSSIKNEDSLILIPGTHLLENIHNSCPNILDNKISRVGRSVTKDEHSFEDPTTIHEVDMVGFEHLNFRNRDNAHITSKRLRKPTRRLIEEISDIEPRCRNGRLRTTIGSGVSNLNDSANDQYQFKGSRAMLPGSDIQLLCGLHEGRDRPGKDTAHRLSESEAIMQHVRETRVPNRSWASQLSGSESQDDLSDDYTTTKFGKILNRRKHHRQWSLSEVMKLIEGVSLHGVSRWTEIKRQLFSTSSHRTAVDLKDKWRNLLRASGAQLRGRNKVKPQQNMVLSIPQNALRRIRELSVVHPYPKPRELNLKTSQATSCPSPVSAGIDGTSLRHGKRSAWKQ